MARVLVLYEDSVAVGSTPKDFGPHNFVLACLADRLAAPLWELRRRVDGQAKNSNTKVRAACDKSQLFDRNTLVVAVYDDDRVRTLAGLPATACKRQVTEKLRPGVAGERLRVVLLHSNVETLLDAVLACARRQRSSDGKPMPLERDALLNGYLKDDTRHVRACVLQHLPSLAYLVDKLAAALAN